MANSMHKSCDFSQNKHAHLKECELHPVESHLALLNLHSEDLHSEDSDLNT